METQWLDSNLKIVETLNVPYKLVHWDHWLEQEEFSETLREYKLLYDSNNLFQSSLTEDLNRFVNKYYNLYSNYVSKEAFVNNCVNLLLEEFSVWSIIGRTGSYIKIYPAKSLKTANILSEGKITAPKGIANITFAKVSFKKRGSYREPSSTY
ncbi:hypothetical protein FUAX_02080 [Fulvitalea axinellae]|uniref:Uncharacterized protein n=1 Tax=Fulvitalea axinellae TaxID=1182444 RepID=A0AAU9C6U7_9BACT|nr:hypothetical protein FUAX_02080 [Fulvitalea axinellae]